MSLFLTADAMGWVVVLTRTHNAGARVSRRKSSRQILRTLSSHLISTDLHCFISLRTLLGPDHHRCKQLHAGVIVRPHPS